jgi:hypothetical protein
MQEGGAATLIGVSKKKKQIVPHTAPDKDTARTKRTP